MSININSDFVTILGENNGQTSCNSRQLTSKAGDNFAIKIDGHFLHFAVRVGVYCITLRNKIKGVFSIPTPVKRIVSDSFQVSVKSNTCRVDSFTTLDTNSPHSITILNNNK